MDIDMSEPTSADAPITFLTLPLEIRLQIYSNLLVLPSHNQGAAYSASDIPTSEKRAEIQSNILRTCRQACNEAAPLLYRGNMWLAHPTLLTGLPRLRPHFGPVVQTSAYRFFKNNPGVESAADGDDSKGEKRPNGGNGRWHVRVRLDCDPPWTADQLAEAFSGADELYIQLWQTAYKGAGPRVAMLFEKIRGVRVARVDGSTYAFRHYANHLENVMQLPLNDKEERPYVKPKGFKERELPKKLPGEEVGSDDENESDHDADVHDDSSEAMVAED
ncbi:hypothetical protein MKZ38_000865 [Zalerion maritima]|uniref:Uncharacterized protein n=1 Tax=Zalerion maritima TaxID=339359 RepID=A0AAD5WY48_9PEZI|nr:hypothetical protein MKZ38_000865 [Zalerion maritima]